MKQLVFISLLLLVFWEATSQRTFSIQGSVLTNAKEVLSIGDVLLYQNDKIIQYTSIVAGKFSFQPVSEGNYVLKILSVGYEPYEKTLILQKNEKLEIQLKESSIALDEVTIKATKKVFEVKGGNVIANIEGTLLSKETNAVELLSKLPAIQISPDGEQISILGKGTPLLYIGRQRISVEELQSLQVDDIQRIEIINNPSAKYEANGRAVLLITKRRNIEEGTELSITEKAASKTFFNNNLGTNLTVKKKNVEYKLNAAYNQLKVWERNSAAYEVTDRNIFSDYVVEAVTTRPQFIFGGGLYYGLNATDYISFNTRYRTQNEPFTIDTNTFLEENGVAQNINTSSENEGLRIFSSSNVNYFKSFGEKKHLFLGGQYTNFTRQVGNSIQNTFDTMMATSQVTISQDLNVENFVLKGDYDWVGRKGGKVETGFNYARNASKSVLEINRNRSDYRYTEAIHSIYSQFSGKKQKVNYSFGLRIENTKVEGGFLESDALLIDRQNTFLFPRGNIDISLSKESSMNFSFVKSISRPNFSTAVTTTAFLNPVLEFQGNINLKPTITSEISSNIQLKDKSITLRYYRNKDAVSFRFFYDETRDITIMSPTNFEEEIGWTLDFTTPFKYRFWTSTNTISINYNTINDARFLKRKTTPYVYLFTNQQFKINNSSSVTINGWLLTNREDGIFNRNQVFTINTGYTTKLFSKLDLTISANDIFNSLEFRESYVLQNLRVNNLFYTDIHEFSIALKYVFGAVKKSNYKNKSVDEELNRVN